MIKCERCSEETPKGHEIRFVSKEDGKDYSKRLCKDCFEITEYASSAESWNADADKQAKRWYFDKQ